MKLIYLACPYFSESLDVMKRRVDAVTRKAAELMAQGYNVFSPLTHSDPIADHLEENLRGSHEFWLSRDFQILEKCDEFHVLCIEGWDTSVGVSWELDFAKLLGKPICLHI